MKIGTISKAAQSVNLRANVTTVLASSIAYQLTRFVGAQTGYWAAITAILVCQSEMKTTLRASRDRIIGTAIGALAGWLTASLWGSHILAFATALLCTLVLCNILKLDVAGRLAGVALAVVVLVHRVQPIWRTASDRFIEVSVGVIIALITTVTVDFLTKETKSSVRAEQLLSGPIGTIGPQE